MLTEKAEQELFISNNGMIRVKDFIVIEKDGIEISRSKPHSKVIDVEDDVTNESDRVKEVSVAVWTPEIKAARIAQKAAEKAAQGNPN